jgi:hypothetical protein
MLTIRACSATRAARFADRTDANVAIASTSVPPPVTSDDASVQSTAVRYRTSRPVFAVKTDSYSGPRKLASMVNGTLTPDFQSGFILIILVGINIRG